MSKIIFVKRILSSIACLVLVMFSGCTHRIEIKNLAEYRSTSINPLTKRIIIGIVSTEEDLHVKRIVKNIGMELQKYSGEVVLPYYANSTKKVDLIADIRITPEYKGSAANFFINFPGFLIWTPAWHGYHYNVSYSIDVALIDGAKNEKFDSFSSPVKLKVRHAQIDRTWTEISWLEVGAIALIGGLYSMSYDPDVTPLLSDAAGHTIGEYVTDEIVSRVNGSGRFVSLLKKDDVSEMLAWR